MNERIQFFSFSLHIQLIWPTQNTMILYSLFSFATVILNSALMSTAVSMLNQWVYNHNGCITESKEAWIPQVISKPMTKSVILFRPTVH